MVTLLPEEETNEFRDAPFERELARLIAMLDVDASLFLDRVSMRWTNDSSVEDDIHFLLASAHTGGTRSPVFRERCARALALLHRKMRRGRRDVSRFWPARVAEAFRGLRERDEALSAKLVNHDAFGLPEHSLFVPELPKPLRIEAIRRLVALGAEDSTDSEGWDGGIVELIEELPPAEARAALRPRARDPRLRDRVATVLARFPANVDRELFVECLGSQSPSVVRTAATALADLSNSAIDESAADETELAAGLEAFRAACVDKKDRETRGTISKLLARWLGAAPPEPNLENPHVEFEHWVGIASERHPELAAELAASSVETRAVLERLDAIAALSGDRDRGATIWAERGCAGCHEGARRLGPDLKGVTARLSLRDLVVAITDPDRDVSPTYFAKEIVTRKGEVYRGLVIYGSPAATILQTSAIESVRFKAADVRSIETNRRSFMPSGLVDGLSDQGVADLRAYLDGLTAR